jgi:hypothetical protein
MAAAQDTSTAIDTAIAAAQAETAVCGGPLLDSTVSLLQNAKNIFDLHEASEDHINAS